MSEEKIADNSTEYKQQHSPSNIDNDNDEVAAENSLLPEALVDDTDGEEEEHASNAAGSEMSSGLEEEDRELIEENLGPIGFRRLQQKTSTMTAQMNSEEDIASEDDERRGFNRKRVAPEELEKLFADEDEEEQRKPSQGAYDYSRERKMYDESEEEDELADFIEDIEEDEGGSTPSATFPMESRSKTLSSSKAYIAETFGSSHLPTRVIKDILEIFGDGTDYLGLLDDDDMDVISDHEAEDDVVDDGHVDKSTRPIARMVDVESCIMRSDVPESLIRRDGDVDRSTPGEDELEEEAAWIIKRWYKDRLTNANEKFKETDPASLHAVVTSVIRLFREQMLEVPTVATHRKEVFQHLLTLNDLWSLWDGDEQWKLFIRQQSIAWRELENMQEGIMEKEESELMRNALRVADSVEMIEIVSDYVRAQQRNAADSTIAAIDKFTRTFALSVTQFIENLSKQTAVHKPPTPEGSIHEQLNGILSGKSEQQQVNAVVSHVSQQIGRHPYVFQYLKAILEPLATISTSPTERGLVEIDSQHELAPIKFITGKPMTAFCEDQFLLLVKGHSIGLLNYEVVFADEVISQIVGLFAPASVDGEWDEVRRRAIKKALDELVIPKVKRELINKLRTDAERWLATSGQYSLQDKLMIAPYENSAANLGRSSSAIARVMAMSWDEGGHDAITFAVIVDTRGRVVEQARFPRLHAKHYPGNEEEWQRLADMITEWEPSCVLVAGRSIATRDLLQDTQREVSRRVASVTPMILFGNDDTARVYVESARAKREWPDAAPLHRYCISVARRWICPLVEITSLSEGELLAMDSNPMSQLVPREMRLKYLQRAAINVVNLVGVDINMALECSWMRASLKYVCGLGPVRADHLVKSIAAASSGDNRLTSRAKLADLLPHRVYTNCASFIRIRCPVEVSSKKKSIPTGWNPLDDTRIHPENYALARKMAADAMEMSLEQAEQSTECTAVIKVMQQPTRLDDLLLEEYAKELVKRGQPSKHLTLFDIKAELQRPYADLRSVVKGPDAETIFEMLTGENERVLWIGAPVRVTIVRLADRLAMGRLASGLPAALLPDRSAERRTNYRLGQVVMTRIVAINLERIEVEVVEMRPGEVATPRLPPDQFYDHERSQRAKETHQRRSDVRVSNMRSAVAPTAMRIGHPAWRDVSRSEAEAILNNALLGEVVLRPSGSKGTNHVSLTWKIDDDQGRVALFQHLDITVRGPKELLIGGERFEDFDEIIARYVEPIAANLRDVRATPKFLLLASADRSTTQAAIESHLAVERAANTDRIAYCLTLSRDRPGNVVLSWQPATRAYHELVEVTPTGYVLREQTFESVQQMIAWFKQNFNARPTHHDRGRSEPPAGGATGRRMDKRDDHRSSRR